jgi:hypothetical protein
MPVRFRSSPFGSESRTRVLQALHLMSQSYPRELARVLDLPLSTIQGALLGLERDTLVVARSVGRTRLFTLNPRYFASQELRRYLAKIVEPEDALRGKLARLRRRPRLTGKP